MKKILLSFFLLFAISNFILGQDSDVTECPYFNVFSTDTTGVAFALASTDVKATVSGVIANVEVQQTYFNLGDSIVDATYVFPMSTNAAIYGMEMRVNDRIIIAEIRRREEAQEIFDNADEAGLTASLLEQERPNVFQMSLANINPGDTLIVSMVYTELLVPREGVYQFVFPSIVGPRFTTNGESWVNQAIQNAFPVSATALNVDLKINAGMSLNAECTSHESLFNYSGNVAQTILNTNPGDDFIVNYTLDDNQIETGLLLYEGEEENFFLSMIQPPKPDISFNSPPREYIFVMDISGSMSGEPIEVSKSLIINLLNDLNADDKFNIIVFSEGTTTFSPSSLTVTDENIESAINMIDDLVGGGGTHLLPALQLALDMEGTEDFSRTFVILTDGYVTVEKEAFDLIRENLNEANFFAFGIGNSVNRFIIEGIAYVGEGESFVATDFNDANEMAAIFKNYVEHPALTNIEILFDGIEAYDVEPLTVPDVFAERPIIIYGKYNTPTQGSITLNGDYANNTYSSTLNFSDYAADVEENIALQYLWARKRIKLMSDYGIASNEFDTISIEEEITLLGLKYSLITEFTAFVAVDSSAVSSGSNQPPDDDGGVIVEVLELPESDSEKSLITVLGGVKRSGGVLRIKVEGLAPLETKDLKLQVMNVNGKLINIHNMEDVMSGEIIILPLGQIAAGTYFVSLVSRSQVLDTEKFIIIN